MWPASLCSLSRSPAVPCGPRHPRLLIDPFGTPLVWECVCVWWTDGCPCHMPSIVLVLWGDLCSSGPSVWKTLGLSITHSILASSFQHSKQVNTFIHTRIGNVGVSAGGYGPADWNGAVIQYWSVLTHKWLTLISHRHTQSLHTWPGDYWQISTTNAAAATHA